jgi:hypothetical protein
LSCRAFRRIAEDRFWSEGQEGHFEVSSCAKSRALDPAAIERELAEVLVWHCQEAKGYLINIESPSRYAKWVVELGVEVGSRLALTSTQLNGVLAATGGSLCIAVHCYERAP